MKFLEFDSHAPYLNLALEEILLHHLPPGHEGYFILWQNRPSVIIGRHQCPDEAVNLTALQEQNLPLVRRISGGGAVYHDFGNLNFSFLINSPSKPDFGQLLKPVCQALNFLGLEASISGRNDILVSGRKISGSSQYFHGNKMLQHGTLLVELDVEKMTSLLRTDSRKLKAHGVQSLAARVINLGELSAGKITVPILKKVLIKFCAEEKISLPQNLMARAFNLVKYKYANPKWNFHAISQCNFEKRERFPWGEIIFQLKIKDNIIQKCWIRGDFFNYSSIAELEKEFQAQYFSCQNISTIVSPHKMSVYFAGCDPQIMRDFFIRSALV